MINCLGWTKKNISQNFIPAEDIAKICYQTGLDDGITIGTGIGDTTGISNFLESELECIDKDLKINNNYP